jgi:S1-C subfamily serine protease
VSPSRPFVPGPHPPSLAPPRWRAWRSSVCAAAAGLSLALTAPPAHAAGASAAAPASPIPKVAIGFSKLLVRIDGDDSIGLASIDFHVRLIERMRAKGFDAVGAENLVFGKDESNRARYMLGGTVRELACKETSKGVSCRIGVEWQVLDVGSDGVVYKVMSRAVVRDEKNKDKGHMAGLLLDEGLDALLKRDGFRRALARKEDGGDAESSDFAETTIAKCARGRGVATHADDSLARVVIVKTHDGFGSGFFVSAEGLILTAAHVVETAPLKVQTRDGTELEAIPVRVNRQHDMALLRLKERPASQPCMALRTDTARSGTPVYAVGAPASLALAFSLTRGIVSGYPTVADRRLLQTDAPVNPGNSGGPIVDESGAVLGVVSFKLVASKIEGIAFAVPIPEVLDALGLTIGDATDPSLLTEAATVAKPPQEALFTDTADEVPSLDPEGDRRRREDSRRRAVEAEEEAERARAAREAAQAEADRDRRTPGYVGVLKWGGLAVAAGGTVGALFTYSQYDSSKTTQSSFESLRAWNAVGWSVAALGAGAFGVSFFLRAPAAPPKSSPEDTATLGFGPAGVTVRGAF